MTEFKDLLQTGTTGEFAFCLYALTFTGHCSKIKQCDTAGPGLLSCKTNISTPKSGAGTNPILPTDKG